MALRETTDVDEIRQVLGDAVAVDPVGNTVLGAILVGIAQDGATPWAAHPAHQPLVLAARSRSTTPVALTRGWTDVSEVGSAIAALEPPAAGLAADPAVIDELLAVIGRAPSARMDERLFRLDELVPPTGVPGVPRPATPDDLDLLVTWFLDFGEEAFGRRQSRDDAYEQVRSGVARGRCWLWTVDGATVSFAHRNALVAGAGRIGPVYTPPAHRRNGYASAATAAAARDVIEAGSVPCLYTDLANPTSNRIYQAIGFRPVLDRCAVMFE